MVVARYPSKQASHPLSRRGGRRGCAVPILVLIISTILALVCFPCILVLSNEFSFSGEASVPLRSPIDHIPWTSISRLKSATSVQTWAVNSISWLVGLARTFDERRDEELAIAIYRKLAEEVLLMDHKISETNRTSLSYFCLYRISRCYLDLNETQEAVAYAKKAFQVLPRKEPYYHVARYYEMHEKDESTALHYYDLASKAPKLPADVPFGETNIYALDIEREIMWPKAFPHTHLQDLQRHQDILDDTAADEEIRLETHGAMIFITRPLFYADYDEIFRKEGAFRPDDDNNMFYYSTPTILRLHPDRPDNYIIVCRLINYRIDPVTRQFRDILPGVEGTSLRSALALHRGVEDSEGSLITVSDEAFAKSGGSGPEDPKLLRVHRHVQDEDDLVLTMTSSDYPNIAGNGTRMVSGILHSERAVLELKHAFPSPNDRDREKNWVAFQVPDEVEAKVHFIYEWHPLTIGTLKEDANHVIEFHTTIDTPRSFEYLRGSSNGVAYQQEIWFMVHGVGHIGYTYYHKFVVLDAKTLHVKRHSYPFKLEGSHTEFCLGLDIDEKSQTMTIAYSVLDGSCVLRRIALWKVEALMVNKASTQT